MTVGQLILEFENDSLPSSEKERAAFMVCVVIIHDCALTQAAFRGLSPR